MNDTAIHLSIPDIAGIVSSNSFLKVSDFTVWAELYITSHRTALKYRGMMFTSHRPALRSGSRESCENFLNPWDTSKERKV